MIIPRNYIEYRILYFFVDKTMLCCEFPFNYKNHYFLFSTNIPIMAGDTQNKQNRRADCG